ncbi:hypothetical protein [Sphingomonas sp. R1]|uniref:hypothetical protein n=1 Tax=Sphingomonas sp. R1 TaxID=399176 RepID=UPI002224B783|nr:hypothetical protein [Sphingomonas sp. R1]UYY78317.1 hypothetical protein OIM94_04750 [Sphingomonas sp. R1]
MISSFLFALAMAGSADCHTVPGAERLWAPGVRYVVVGELHGTNETPDGFANLACLAGDSGRPVTVALEYPADAQAAIDAWLQSDGSERARAALLALPIWHGEMQDGRGSVAFLRLFERLRVLKQAGRLRGVVASDVVALPQQGTRDAAMAESWKRIDAGTDGIVLVLVGNLHAMRQEREGFQMVPAASFLPRDRTVTLNVVGNGGEAWNCQAEGCGAHRAGPERAAAEGIVLSDDAADSWDARYELGKPMTAAGPAIPKAGG